LDFKGDYTLEKRVLFVSDSRENRHAASDRITRLGEEVVSLALGSIDDDKSETAWHACTVGGYDGAIVQLFEDEPEGKMPWGLIQILALREVGIPVVGYVLSHDNLGVEMHQFVTALSRTLSFPIHMFSPELADRSWRILIEELENQMKICV